MIANFSADLFVEASANLSRLFGLIVNLVIFIWAICAFKGTLRKLEQKNQMYKHSIMKKLAYSFYACFALAILFTLGDISA
jgi:hypothetical protein